MEQGFGLAQINQSQNMIEEARAWKSYKVLYTPTPPPFMPLSPAYRLSLSLLSERDTRHAAKWSIDFSYIISKPGPRESAGGGE